MAQVKALKRSNDDLKKQRKNFETKLDRVSQGKKSPKTKNKNMAYGISRHVCKCNFVIYFIWCHVSCSIYPPRLAIAACGWILFPF